MSFEAVEGYSSSDFREMWATPFNPFVIFNLKILTNAFGDHVDYIPEKGICLHLHQWGAYGLRLFCVVGYLDCVEAYVAERH